MMMTLENLVATKSEKSTRIGWLFWYVIAEKPTDAAVTKAAFRSSGLPEMYRLPDIRPADAYRRATKSIEGRVELPGDDKVDLLVRDVFHNAHEVVRHLVVEFRNTQGRRLDYDTKAAMLRFDHDNRGIDVSSYSGEPFVTMAVNQFLSNYNLYLSTYDGAAKRRVARSVVLDLSGTALKESGGVYLVPRDGEELLFQLVAFINGLPDCQAYKMPVEDTEESRDMVRDLVTNKAEMLLSEIRAAMKANVVGDDNIQSLLEKAKRMKKEIVTYQNILRESIGTFETDVDLLEMQMLNLLDQL